MSSRTSSESYVQHSRKYSHTDMTRMTIRWAAPHEGPVIESLFLASQYLMAYWADWKRPLQGNWILAETTCPIGCLMVNFGVPFGRLEYLVLLPDLSPILRARTISRLYRAGLSTLRKAGSQIVNFDVRTNDFGWQHAVGKRGALCVGTGNFYIRKV